MATLDPVTLTCPECGEQVKVPVNAERAGLIDGGLVVKVVPNLTAARVHAWTEHGVTLRDAPNWGSSDDT